MCIRDRKKKGGKKEEEEEGEQKKNPKRCPAEGLSQPETLPPCSVVNQPDGLGNVGGRLQRVSGDIVAVLLVPGILVVSGYSMVAIVGYTVAVQRRQKEPALGLFVAGH